MSMMVMYKYTSKRVEPTRKERVFSELSTYEGLLNAKPDNYQKGDLSVYYKIESLEE